MKMLLRRPNCSPIMTSVVRLGSFESDVCITKDAAKDSAKEASNIVDCDDQSHEICARIGFRIDLEGVVKCCAVHLCRGFSTASKSLGNRWAYKATHKSIVLCHSKKQSVAFKDDHTGFAAKSWKVLRQVTAQRSFDEDQLDFKQVSSAAHASQRVVQEPYFAVYHDSFLRILGAHPGITLAIERNWPFAHEAGVYIPHQDAIFVTSNLLTPEGKLDPEIRISKVSRQEDGSWTSSLIETNVVMGNGGINYQSGVLFCAQGNMKDLGGLVVMESQPPYATKTLINSFHGRPFNSVNDVVIKMDGSIWFTDPVYGFEQGYKRKPQLPCQVYRYDPLGGDIRVLADGFGRPNGICFSPDEETLYVTDTDWIHGDGGIDPTRPSTIYAFDIEQRHGSDFLMNRRVFAFAANGIPDGIKCDVQGNVYSGCGDGINVWNSGGTLIGKIVVPGGCANFAFTKKESVNISRAAIVRSLPLVATVAILIPSNPRAMAAVGDKTTPSAADDSDSSREVKSHHKGPKSEREKRTCVTSDGYSSGEPGRPPCERCIREQHECILGGSRRGGRRVKRAQPDFASHEFPGQVPGIDSMIRPLSIPPPRNDYQSSSNSEPPQMWPGLDRESRILPPLPQELPARSTGGSASKLTVDDLSTTDIQNPKDALEFLAHVAERDSGVNQLPPMHSSVYGQPALRTETSTHTMHEIPRSIDGPIVDTAIDYPPLVRGHLSLDTIRVLLARFEEKYHQFFSIANPLALDPTNLPEIASKEPHLLAAILTVASKDEKEWWQVHETCSAHMQQLIAELVYSGCGEVEAVEAMLILAEWVPRRPHSTPTVGRGEEDQAAWMYVGTAIRLGYLLGIDRTGFRADTEAQSAELNRKRLAGPLTALRAQDFPSLQPRSGRTQDDFAAIRSNQLNFGGEYVKYIDDFRTALRSWNGKWGTFSASAPMKASLVLSYEYLRLYVNAFAYQATLNRLVSQFQAASANGQQLRSPTFPFADVAATPDARFIYDSIDAAKSLLSTFNSFVDPENTFRYMPLRYYLYVIYSACFLYKARSTGVMGGDTRGSIKRLILDTIDKLQRASACPNDIGDRYSRLVKLLWRKSPGRGSIAEGANIHRASISAQRPAGGPGNVDGAPELQEQPVGEIEEGPSINTFSWLDLPAVGEFATQNNANSMSGSMDIDRFDDSSADGFGGFEQSMMMMPQNFQWNNMSPSGILF
nr:gluconolactonase [Quercus suber]